MRITIEMPTIEACEATGCAYNVERACHARAITIGHGVHPGCDTYVVTGRHVSDGVSPAGVGACKVDVCQHNQNLECTASTIRVEDQDGTVECGTFDPKP